MGESGAAHRDSAVGVGSLSAARFFDFLGCGPRPEGDGVNGANVQGPATSSSGVGDGVFLRRVAVAVFLACFVARPEDAGADLFEAFSCAVRCSTCRLLLDFFC